MGSVGIRELKQNASAVLARVKGGEVVMVTERGTPVGQITPLPASVIDRLIAAGQVTPAQYSLAALPLPEPGPTTSGRTLSDAVVAARNDDR
jgi:prevent-host-death family protein